MRCGVSRSLLTAQYHTEFVVRKKPPFVVKNLTIYNDDQKNQYCLKCDIEAEGQGKGDPYPEMKSGCAYIYFNFNGSVILLNFRGEPLNPNNPLHAKINDLLTYFKFNKEQINLLSYLNEKSGKNRGINHVKRNTALKLLNLFVQTGPAVAQDFTNSELKALLEKSVRFRMTFFGYNPALRARALEVLDGQLMEALDAGLSNDPKTACVTLQRGENQLLGIVGSGNPNAIQPTYETSVKSTPNLYIQ